MTGRASLRGAATLRAAIALTIGALALAGCAAGPTPTPTLLPSLTATATTPATATARPPTHTPQPTMTPRPAGPTPAEQATPTPPPGPIDVYMGPPDSNGRHALHFIDVEQRTLIAETVIRPAAGTATCAGQFVYYLAAGTRQPQRVNARGESEPLSFALPPNGASLHQIMPSANGEWLAWASIGSDGASYVIGHAARDGAGAQVAAKGTFEPGTRIEMVRVANDGERLFYALRPPELAADEAALFDSYYELFALDVQSGRTRRLPGEPACGEGRACDAHISEDGTLLVRTLSPQISSAPVVVTNLVSGMTAARFAPRGVAGTSGFELGYPLFTPSGELVYMVAAGIPEAATTRLVWANIVTGEQRLIAYLDTARHRPLGWAEDGSVLLTTREPGHYDTWRIDLRDGSVRQVSSMMFLGRIQPEGD